MRLAAFIVFRERTLRISFESALLFGSHPGVNDKKQMNGLNKF